MKIKTNIKDPFFIIALFLIPGAIYYAMNHQINKLAYCVFFSSVFIALGTFRCWPLLTFDIGEFGIRISQFGRELYILTWEKVRTIGTISTRYGVYVYASALTCEELIKFNMRLRNYYRPDEYTYLGSILDKQYMMNKVIWKKDRINLIKNKPFLRLDSVQSGHRDKEIIRVMKQYSKQFALQNGQAEAVVYHFGPWDNAIG